MPAGIKAMIKGFISYHALLAKYFMSHPKGWLILCFACKTFHFRRNRTGVLTVRNKKQRTSRSLFFIDNWMLLENMDLLLENMDSY